MAIRSCRIFGPGVSDRDSEGHNINSNFKQLLAKKQIIYQRTGIIPGRMIHDNFRKTVIGGNNQEPSLIDAAAQVHSFPCSLQERHIASVFPRQPIKQRWPEREKNHSG
jgi:hypothetical protein